MLSLVAAASMLFPAQQPNLQYRWVYVMTNLQVAEQVDKVIALSARAKKAGYNGIVVADTKLQRLAFVPEWYATNTKKLLDACKSQGMDVIPCVFPVGYADGMLANDPNLVEGQPVRGAEFVVKSGEAQVVATNLFRNGDMEQASSHKLAGMGFQDSIGTSTFIDTTVKHEGAQSLRMADPIVGMPDAGNCRIQQEITVKPHRQYHLSAWVKTQNFDRAGGFGMKAFDPAMKLLTTQEVKLPATTDWTQLHVTFNSGDSDKARIYAGVWGGNKGTLWLDDVRVEEVGLLNVIRRPSCPVTVRSSSGTLYTEGKDYAPISDPRMGQVPWPGGFEVYHPAPPIKLLPGSRIREGEKLLVDFDHALISADNQVAVCMSEPKTAEVMRDEARRVQALFNPRGMFMSHDEIRAGNWDTACQKNGMEAGALLAQNARQGYNAVRTANPKAEVYVWSDMFDPFHNARKDYYTFRGDLTGSWNGLPKDTIIVNWYFGPRKQNMPFFAENGWRQILAGYYDGDPRQIRTWLDDGKSVRSVVGVMYTTWVGNYADLERFAEYAWGGQR